MKSENFIQMHKNMITEILYYLDCSNKKYLLEYIRNKKIWSIVKNQLNKPIFYENPSYLKEIKKLRNDFSDLVWIEKLIILFTNTAHRPIISYPNNQMSIQLFDLYSEEIIKVIPAGNKFDLVSCLKHYYDYDSSDDLLFVSFNKPLINVYSSRLNYEIYYIIDTNYTFTLSSFIVFRHKLHHTNYLVSYAVATINPIRVFEITGRFIKGFGKPTYFMYFLKLWLNKNLKKYYIISLTKYIISIYDFETGELYRSFSNNVDCCHSCLVVNRKSLDLLLVCYVSSISVWNIENCIEEKVIKPFKFLTRGLVQWNLDYFIVGCNESFLVFDLDGNIYSHLKIHDQEISCIIKYKHRKLGEILISCGKEGIIKILGF